MNKTQLNSKVENKRINKKSPSSNTKAQNVRESIKEFKERMRKNGPKPEEVFDFFPIEDFYSKVTDSISVVKKGTGICFDEFMTLHKCTWDPKYPECPERYQAIIDRCKNLGLLERCERIKPRQAKRESISRIHDKNLYLKLKEICEIQNRMELEQVASDYDAIYFNEHTLEAALYAAGCCLAVTENVCKGTVKNGFAIVRPPGHHAMYDEFCGYCYFNNVAVAAQHALDQKLAKRILIVDFDIHHGQGTQRAFYDNNRVLYFSIHRYENGTFWPNLRESNFDFIGKDAGRGFNINVPLNQTGLDDSDYMAIVQHILLPVAYEYQPDLILTSAGFDSSMGCLEGMMLVTPAFYSHLLALLSALALGKLVVCLEGGYFLPSLAEGAALSLGSLLGDPPPILPPMRKPKRCIIDVVNNLKFFLRPFWNCFKMLDTFKPTGESSEGEGVHSVHLEYLGEPPQPPHETRDCYPLPEPGHKERFMEAVKKLSEEYQIRPTNQTVCYCYDEEMLLHKTKLENGYEEPVRLKTLLEKFYEFDLDKRCKQVEPKSAELDILQITHGEDYAKNISVGAFKNVKMSKRDIYTCDDSTKSILKSSGCLLSIVDAVLSGNAGSGAAFIRPPGHHAEYEEASGFCFINNVAVAANYILEKYKLQRILIVDFDIHHGNGTQNLFYESSNVLYISIHRYEYANYFPYSKDADYDRIGKGMGEGFNVNIPLNKEKHGNSEYISIFHRIVLPIAYSFAPEVVLISAGFDAGINDPLGHYKITPEAFGHFVQLLKPLANGRTILALEGGYNPTTLAYSMVMCVKALLNDPLPALEGIGPINASAHASIENVIGVQRKYWPILEVNKKLPLDVSYLKVFDGAQFLEIQRPSLSFLSCSVIELKNRMQAEKDRGDMDDIAKCLGHVTLT